MNKGSFDPVRLAAGGLALVAAAAVIGGIMSLRQPVAAKGEAAPAINLQQAGAVYVGKQGETVRNAAAQRVRRLSAPPAGGSAATPAPARIAAVKPAIDGKAVYDGLCFACHTSGVGNAPMLERAHWGKRLAQGKDVLYRHAIDGYTGPDGGMMPPKGGNPSLSDAEIRASVDWMLGNLK